MTIYYQDDAVTLHHSRWEDILPDLSDGSVDHVITDPPYSEKTHKSVRSSRMSANDRGGRYGADVRRQVDLGFDHLGQIVRAITSGLIEPLRVVVDGVTYDCTRPTEHQAGVHRLIRHYRRTDVPVVVGVAS